MKRPCLLLTTIAALAACDLSSPWHDAWYKEGAAMSLAQTHQTTCQASALAAFPVKEEYQRGEDIWIRAEELCNSDGKCITTGGHYVPGRQKLVDVNRTERGAFRRACMKDKGYTRTAIKRCDKSVAAQVQPVATQIWPRLTENSCIIRHNSGALQVVQLQ